MTKNCNKKFSPLIKLSNRYQNKHIQAIIKPPKLKITYYVTLRKIRYVRKINTYKANKLD